jgi:DNA repair exonuclease SbcCD ATPase subunit
LQLDQAQAQNETLRNEKIELQKKLDQACQDLRSQTQVLSDENKELQTQIVKVTNERNAFQKSDSQLSVLSAEDEKLRAELEESKQNLEDVRKRESEAARTAGDEKLELEDELEKLTNERNHLACRSLAYEQAVRVVRDQRSLKSHKRMVAFGEDLVDALVEMCNYVNLDYSPVFRECDDRRAERAQREAEEEENKRVARAARRARPSWFVLRHCSCSPLLLNFRYSRCSHCNLHFQATTLLQTPPPSGLS